MQNTQWFELGIENMYDPPDIGFLDGVIQGKRTKISREKTLISDVDESVSLLCGQRASYTIDL